MPGLGPIVGVKPASDPEPADGYAPGFSSPTGWVASVTCEIP